MRASYSLWSEAPNKANMVPPPKPPRMHTRSPIVVKPLQDRSNNPGTPNQSHQNDKFAATNTRQQIIETFRQRLMKDCDSFSGREGYDAMVVSIQQRTNFSLSSEEAGDKALKMLDHWLEERVIRRCVEEDLPDDDRPCYVHNTKVFYTVNPDSEHRVCMMTPGTSRRRDASHSRERPKRNPSRAGSIKRLFGLGGQQQEKQNDAPPVSLEFDDKSEMEVEYSRRSSFGRAVRRVFTQSHAEDTPTLTDEAMLYEVSLGRVLLEVEVPVLDDILMIKDGQEQHSVSLLSSILKKMGLTSSPEEMPDGAGLVAMETILGHNQNVKKNPEVLDWFRAAHSCSLSLALSTDHSVPHGEQLYLWGKVALKAVSDRYRSLTNGGNSPLIPSEFNPILEAIAHQKVMDNPRMEAKKHRIFKLLWWMIPSKLRHHLSQVLQFLRCCESIEGVFNITSPYFIPQKSHLLRVRNSDNYDMCLAELRPFIVSKEAKVTDDDRNAIVEALVTLRQMNNLSRIDEAVVKEIEERKSGRVSTPVVYCRGNVAPISAEDQQFVDMIKGIVDATHWTGREKENKLKMCKQAYPHIMKTHFPQI